MFDVLPYNWRGKRNNAGANCRNLSDNPTLHGSTACRPYQWTPARLDETGIYSQGTGAYSQVNKTYSQLTETYSKVRHVCLWWPVQRAEFYHYVGYLTGPAVMLPLIETIETIPLYFERDGGVLYRSYLPGYLRVCSTFRNQFIVSQMFVNEFHDHVMSSGHMAIGFGCTYYTIMLRSSEWTVRHVRAIRHPGMEQKTYRPLPVNRPFEHVSVDLVEYNNTLFLSPNWIKVKDVFSVIGHSTRCVVLTPISRNSELT